MTWAPAAPAGVRAPCLRCADLLLNKVVAAPHLSHPTAIPPPHTDIPLKKAVAGVRVALLGAPRSGLWVVNPTAAQMAASRLDLVMAGTKDAVLMIEGFCDFLSEEEMLEGIGAGAKAIAGMCEQMEAWAAKVCARGRGVSAAGQEGAGVCTCWQLPRAEHKPTPPVARLRMPPPPPPPAQVGKAKRTDRVLLPAGLEARVKELTVARVEEAYRCVCRGGFACVWLCVLACDVWCACVGGCEGVRILEGAKAGATPQRRQTRPHLAARAQGAHVQGGAQRRGRGRAQGHGGGGH